MANVSTWNFEDLLKEKPSHLKMIGVRENVL